MSDPIEIRFSRRDCPEGATWIRCPFCGHRQMVPIYNDFTCEGCGQEWEYSEGHCPVLTPAILAHKDLLKACQDALAWQNSDVSLDALNRQLNAAIAKATKETPCEED